MNTRDAILRVQDLVTTFTMDDGIVNVLDHINFDLHKGETLGLVGESGCGKSVTALTIMRLLPHPAGQTRHGRIEFAGSDLLALPIRDMHRLRGRRIAMIFQEPMTALNPVHRIGRQVGEVFRLHFPELDNGAVRQAALNMLHKVGIPAPDKRLREYPHQLSGGMRQRVMIAMALACKPDILIADEPTTALDVTTQNQILNLMRELQDDIGMSILFITHDLGVVAKMCDRAIVMYAGRIVEQAPIEALYRQPRHPYTHGLLHSIPRLGGRAKTALFVIEGLVPSLDHLPAGCRFRERCRFEQPPCAELGHATEPVDETGSHRIACARWRDITLDA